MKKPRSSALHVLVLSVLSAALALGLCACAAAFAQEEGGAQGGAAQQGQFAADGGSFLGAQDSEVVDSGTWGTCPWELTADGTLTVHPGTARLNYDSRPWNSSTRRVVFLAENGEYVRLYCSSPRYGLFTGCDSLVSLDLSGLDTSFMTVMDDMFKGCSSLTSLDLSSFDTSSVTDMRSIFNGCSSLTSLDLSSFGTSSVTDMSGMFEGCSSLTSLDLSSFGTSSVTDMADMFFGCSSLTSLDLSSFDTSSVTDMRSMFNGCSSLTSLDLSSFGTSSVTDMSGMFCGCSSLTSLDLSRFDTSSVTDTSWMFYSCSSLTSLDLSSFDTSSVTDMQTMFDDCSSLAFLDLSSFDTSSVTYMNFMFEGCSSLTSLDLSSFDTSSVTAIYQMFFECSLLETIYVGYGFVLKPDCEAYSLFNECYSLVGGNGTVFDSVHWGGEYARIDEPGSPGYFTRKAGPLKDDRSISITFEAGEDGYPKNYSETVKFGPSLFNKSSYEYRQDLAQLAILLCEVACSEDISGKRFEHTVTDGSRGSGLITTKVTGIAARSQRTNVAEYDAQAKSESYVYNAFRRMGASTADVRSYYYEDNMYSWRRGMYPNGNATEGGYGACGYAIGKVQMEIGGEVDDVVFVAVRGTPSNGEWHSNFNVDNENIIQDNPYAPTTASPLDYHQGFSEAEIQIMDSLRGYCADAGLDPEHTKILVTGHSRGAAVANLLAAHLVQRSSSDEKLAAREDVYAYTFASPNVVTGDSAVGTPMYGNIFNIINPEDFVPKVPLRIWSYHRYGVDKVLPSRSNMSSKKYAAAYTKCNREFMERFYGAYQPYPDGTASVDNKLVRQFGLLAPSVRDYYEHNKKLGFLASTPYEYFQSLAAFLAGEGVLGLLNNGLTEYSGITGFFVGNQALRIDPLVLGAHSQHVYYSWMFAYGSESGLYGQSMSAFDDGDPAAGDPADEETPFNGAYRVQRFCDAGSVKVYDSAGDLVCRIENGAVDEGVMENGLAATVGDDGEAVVYLPADDSYTFEVDGAPGARMSVESYDGVQELVARSAAGGSLDEDGTYTGAVAEGEGEGEDAVTLQAPGGSQVELVAAAEGEEAGFVVDIQVEGAGTAWTAGPAYEGEPITAYAEPVGGGEFYGWFVDGELVSSDAEYTFEAREGAVLTARFAEVSFTPTWARVSGSTRYATMAAIAEEAFPGGCDTAVLVNGTDKNFPDALSAAALAGIWDCPIITTAPGSLRDEARAQLERLGVSHVYIVGGPGAVSEAVADEVSWLNSGVEVERVYGSTRYKTSTAVMRAAGEYRRSDTVFLATGTNFPDALAAGPISFSFDCPILLVNPKSGLSADQVLALGEYGAPNVVILGGTNAVPVTVEAQLAGVPSVESVERLAGKTRYETATMLADMAIGMGATAERPIVATALSPADALAGAPLAGRNNSVVLLTSEKKGGDLAVGYLADKSEELLSGRFLGGEKAIPGALAQRYLDATGATMEP